jgi:BNR/Asp-box repeat
MAEAVLLIGTRKGLWVGRSDDSRRQWTLEGPQFSMQGVYSVAADTRGEVPRLFAGGTSEHWGPGVFHSDDLGRSWDEPPEGSIRFPADTGTSLERVWQIQPGPAFEPEVVYAGAEPSSLWRSTDRGVTFELVRGLWDHPHRPKWEPGFGGQAIHTVIPHPDDRNRVTVAMSTGGVYRTADGGDSWAASNSGIKAYFRPDPWPEFGQCVHKIARNPARPDEMFLQNHGGVYRSRDGGETWETIENGLPATFGFPMVAHPHTPGTAYAFPLVADAHRMPPEDRLRVYRTTDSGDSWHGLDSGLPREPAYSTVLRDAMCADDEPTAGVYFGTRGGDVFGSADEGETWGSVARYLPDILSLRAAGVP